MSIITLNTRSLPDSAVTTAKIAADAITDAKIADDVVGTEHLTAGEVDATALGADSVTAAKINNDIISGSTELASEPADTDEFLVSDAGTLKRIDYSLIKGGGITVASQWRINNSPSGLNNNDVVGESGHGNWEQNDTQYSNIGSAMSVSNGVFTFPSTGIYLVTFTLVVAKSGSTRYFEARINATTDNSSYSNIGQSTGHINQVTSGTLSTVTFSTFVDVTDTSNVKVKFSTIADEAIDVTSNPNYPRTNVTFIRLGDT